MSRLLTPEGVLEWLRPYQSGSRILLTTHVRPDGDALGALCGFLLLLRENGFAADAVLPDSVPDYIRSFLPTEGVIAEPGTAELSHYALLVSLDAARRDRVAAQFMVSGDVLPAPSLNIDHHPDNPGFCEANYIVPTAAATSEIIADLAFAAGWKISVSAATLLLIGILTDSGAFRFSNTTPRTLQCAARLMECGGEYHRIMTACFFSKPENMARFEADLLCNHLKKAFDGQFFYTYFEPELLKRYGIELRNTEQVIEILRAIDGPKIVATIRVEEKGFKCSLRSKDPRYSVGRIARAIGGGGHEMAAGCSIQAASLEEAEQTLLNHVEKELNENPE